MMETKVVAVAQPRLVVLWRVQAIIVTAYLLLGQSNRRSGS